ncbi:sensor histidine kinase [Frondihabitans cladoniiphilus]|uniref:histidine kinase n=1 Tax=Frondihabitans cladoniiphilus TaxID=715785 RepID=A0ABP8VZ57_9MICO
MSRPHDGAARPHDGAARPHDGAARPHDAYDTTHGMMADVTTTPPASPRPGLSPVLNLAGAVVVGYWVATEYVIGATSSPVLLATVAGLALAGWVVRAYLRNGIVRDVAAAVMILGGAFLVVPTIALMITPVIIAVAGLTAELRHRIGVGIVAALVAAAIVVVTALLQGHDSSLLLGTMAGLALGVVVGITRRQVAAAEVRERELLTRTLEIEREQQRSALLADRASVARDIHDVLAHSLGGLVIQLDAVEALLEAGRIDDAASRVAAARTLAAEGLGEARRAVATLRDPGRHEPGVEERNDVLSGADAIDRLLSAHESLGGAVVAEGTGALARPDAAHRRAVAAVLREALSNARRHAPGETVALAVSEVSPGILRLTVSNALAESPAGGASPSPEVAGHGLLGMRERFAELHDESTLDAGERGGRWVVTATVPIPPGAMQTTEDAA